MAIACAGAFLAFLDTTIVNIAFPDISSSFSGSGRDVLSWVLDGYFVVIAALLVPAGGLPTASAIGGSSSSASPASPPSACLRAAPSLDLLIAARVSRESPRR